MTDRIAGKQLGIVVLVGVLLVCSLGLVSAAESVEIKIGYYESSGGLGQYSIMMNQIIEEFMKAHPGIRMTPSVAAYSSFFAKLPVELAAGTGPDVWLCDGVLVDQYSAQGLALDLTDRLAAMPNPNDYFGIDANRDPDGRIWAFPQGLQSSALFHSKEHFELAGLAPPTDKWTYGDLRKAAQKLTADTDSDGVPNRYGFRSFNHVTEGWFPIIKAFGGGLLDATRRKSLVNSPKTIEALSYMVDMVLVDRSSPPATTSGPFNWFPQGLVSMQIGLFVRTDAANKGKIDYDVTQVPSGLAGRFNPVIVNSWVINADTSKTKQDAAWEWIKYFSGEHAQTMWAELSEAVPVNRKVAVTHFVKSQAAPKNRMAFVTGLDYAAPLDPSPVWSNWVNAVTSALTPAFRGTVSVNEAAANAHQGVQQALDAFYLQGK